MVGIYKINNKINNKIYIGQTVNIEKRWYKHKWDLNNNKHTNKHLQRAWNKYGEDNFHFSIIEECDTEELDIKEKDYIQLFDSFKNGYNRTLGGEHGNRGMIVSMETRRKLSELLKGRKYGRRSDQARINIKNGLKKYYKTHKIHCLKTNKEDAIKILTIHKNLNVSSLILGELFNVKRNVIIDIIEGRSWKELDSLRKEINEYKKNHIIRTVPTNILNLYFKIESPSQKWANKLGITRQCLFKYINILDDIPIIEIGETIKLRKELKIDNIILDVRFKDNKSA